MELGKEYIKAVYCHPTYKIYAECIIRNPGLEEAQAGIKISRRNINKLRYENGITLMKESRGTKEPLGEGWKMRVKELV